MARFPFTTSCVGPWFDQQVEQRLITLHTDRCGLLESIYVEVQPGSRLAGVVVGTLIEGWHVSIRVPGGGWRCCWYEGDRREMLHVVAAWIMQSEV